MGLSVSAVIADTELTDAQLTAVGLYPRPETAATSEVMLNPADDRVLVTRHGGHTIIVDGAAEVAEQFEGTSTELPGRVVVAGTVDSVGYAVFRVFDNGRAVRVLETSDGEIVTDEGEPLSQEDSFVFRTDGDVEVDGQLLIDTLASLASVPGSPDIFELEGKVYALAGTGLEVEPGSAPGHEHLGNEALKPQKKGFFGRLFG